MNIQDMMFAPGTPASELIRVKIKSAEDDEWSETDLDIPELLTYPPYQFCRFIVAQPENSCDGYFDRQNQVLCISPTYQKNDATILHEMIHMHEFVINEYPLFYHDTMLWSLYSDLKNKIPELDTIINEHAHILNESTLYASGGLHDILFCYLCQKSVYQYKILPPVKEGVQGQPQMGEYSVVNISWA